MKNAPVACLPSTFGDSERPALPSLLGAEHFTALWTEMLPFVRSHVRGRLSRAGMGTAIRRVRFAAGEAAPELALSGSVRAAVVHDDGLVEDIAQEVGLALFRHLRDAPSDSRLRAHRSDAERWLTVAIKLTAQRGADRAARSLAWGAKGSPDGGESPTKAVRVAGSEWAQDPETALARAGEARRVRGVQRWCVPRLDHQRHGPGPALRDQPR